jgi:predicted AAA+ superfamily ATPase
VVHRISKPALPLSAYADSSAFKVYSADIGLLRRQARLAPSVFTEGDRLFTEFKGALSENYALQALIPQLDSPLMYWSDGKSRFEVDFIAQVENDIYPIEVKSSTNVESKSLREYGMLFADASSLKARLSMANLKKDGQVLNIPLYLADHAIRIIKMAKEREGI